VLEAVAENALVGISAPETQASTPAVTPAPTTPAPVTPATVAKKKTHKARPAAIVTYSDPKTGVSFRYPRKYQLASATKLHHRLTGSAQCR